MTACSLTDGQVWGAEGGYGAWEAALGVAAEVQVQEQGHQASLLCCIFGNPFQAAPSIEPAWPVLNNATVKKLAEAAYEHRSVPDGALDQARLAVLEDALDEAGCAYEEILGHLRGPGPHVRGCHVVDF